MTDDFLIFELFALFPETEKKKKNPPQWSEKKSKKNAEQFIS